MARQKKSYAENLQNKLRQNDNYKKFDRPGIYGISIDNILVYIGKSENMLRRLSEHIVGIKTQSERKYEIMAEAKFYHFSVNFKVLYYAKSTSAPELKEELGAMEGQYIRTYLPPLNRFIPLESDWHHTKENPEFRQMTLGRIMGGEIN